MTSLFRDAVVKLHAARGTARPCRPHGHTQHVVASVTIHKSASGSKHSAVGLYHSPRHVTLSVTLQGAAAECTLGATSESAQMPAIDTALRTGRPTRYFAERGAHSRRVPADPEPTRVTLAVTLELCSSSVKCVVLFGKSAHMARMFVLLVVLKISII